MSSVVELVDLLATAIGGDMKQVQADAADLASKRGDMTTLITTHKATLVGAMNELKNAVDNVDVTTVINDAVTAGDSAWSSNKVQSSITSAIDGLVNGAPGTFDTLKEISDYIASDQSAATAIQASLAKRVRVDAVQTFTEVEKAQGRSNLDAVSDADHTALSNGVGDYASADPVSTYATARDA